MSCVIEGNITLKFSGTSYTAFWIYKYDSLILDTSRHRIFKNEDVLFNSYSFIRDNKHVLTLNT